MIGGYYEHIVNAHIFEKSAEISVELGQGFCVAVDIVPVSKEHIEVDEIDKTEAGEILFLKFERFLHAIGVIFVDTSVIRNAAGGKNIIYLADGYDI